VTVTHPNLAEWTIGPSARWSANQSSSCLRQEGKYVWRCDGASRLRPFGTGGLRRLPAADRSEINNCRSGTAALAVQRTELRLRGKDEDNDELYKGPRALSPATVASVTGLTRLSLVKTRIRSLPSAAILAQSSLRGFRLEANPILDALPDRLEDLPSLQVLHVDRCPIRSLPAFPLKSLIELSLNDTKLRIVPDWIGDLPQLTRLCLAGNQLAGLPDTLARARRLRSLCVARNHLTNLPQVASLSKLRMLDARHNGLDQSVFDHLPEGIEQLELDDNRITAVPAKLARFEQLSHCSLRRNLVRTVSPAAFSLAKLQDLPLEGNPLSDPVFGHVSREGGRSVRLNPQGDALLQVIRDGYGVAAVAARGV